MDTAIIYCVDCDKASEVKFDYLSEIFDPGCPICKGQNIFLQEVIYKEQLKEKKVKLGVHPGCSQK